MGNGMGTAMGVYSTASIGPLVPLFAHILGAGRGDGLYSGFSMVIAVVVGASLSSIKLGTCGVSD